MITGIKNCYLAGGDCSSTIDGVLSGYAIIDLERFQEMLLGLEDYELAKLIQKPIDNAKNDALFESACNSMGIDEFHMIPARKKRWFSRLIDWLFWL